MHAKTFLDRMKEPSTYAGLAAIATAVGLSDAVWAAVSGFLAAAFGLAAIVLREKGETDQAEDGVS